MNKITRLTLLVSPLVTAVLLAVVLFATNPLTIGPAGTMGVFILVYAFSLSILFVILHFGISWLSRLSIAKQDAIHRREFRMSARKAYYIASVLAFVPVLFLAMRSFAELRITDVILVILFVAIVVFYILKRS